MFAVYASAANPNDPTAGLLIGERPEPSVPDGWVRVHVKAASLNMHDLWTLRGVGIKADAFPMILGCDGAGVLDDGTEVVIHPVINAPGWRGDETLDPKRTLLTERHQGTFADSVVVPEGNVVAKPTELSFVESAALGTAWLTAYRMLFVQAQVRPGQTVLVQGSSGGVATALIQLASAAGVRVWSTGRTEEKRALATTLGAHATFEAGTRLPERVDAVFETVGKATWSHSLKSLRPGGALVVSGTTTGADPSADLQRVFFLQLRVLGSTMGTRQELIDLISFLRLHDIRPQIGLTLPLPEAAAGFAAMQEGNTAGKIVFTR
ncbi:zinc-binding dehydrogenase [Actinoalloteichus hymeniacidonis]|nr:zinc-binding dehydrogenase [Actinoalloteichus hymeniacidonis]MBB5906838.1 NADPH:quinone reductase-like Zn-dependent oxidoreductase [Actinoalloteichus hymeniacidonis]